MLNYTLGTIEASEALIKDLYIDLRAKLPFDTLVGLSRAGRIPSINYCIHVTLLKISSLWYSRSSLRGGNRGGGG